MLATDYFLGNLKKRYLLVYYESSTVGHDILPRCTSTASFDEKLEFTKKIEDGGGP